eukprot:TRINITY_DN3379_c0_g1_i5.p1 TRINITY_DN3379_c0_g1~~TRINITY_DN3379_c0_g1_i5.p1  ORF type:complete len:595 (+),score=254.19 TRINITY_DN3379_c0_g1_i5:106-1890(+)
MEEMRRAMGEKADREEVQRLGQEMVSRECIELLIRNSKGFGSEISRLTTSLEYLEKDLQDKLNVSVFIKQIDEFKAVLAQKASMVELSEAVQAKVSKDDLAAGLQRKADRKEVDSMVSRKVDLADLEKLVGAIERKADLSDLELMQRRVEMRVAELETWTRDPSGKVTAKDLDVALSSLAEAQRMERERLAIDIEKTMNGIRKGVKEDIDSVKKLQVSKVEFDDFRSQLTKEQDKLISDSMQLERRLITVADQLQSEVKLHLRDSADSKKRDAEENYRQVASLTSTVKGRLEEETQAVRAEMAEMKDALAGYRALMQQLVEPKADVGEVQQAITEAQTLVARRITELREELYGNFKSLREEVDKKASVSYVASAVNNKAEQAMFASAIQEKVNISEFGILSSKVDALQSELDQKLSRNDFEQHVINGREQLTNIKKDLLLKANIKDVCTLIDIKASSEDVKKAFNEVHFELERKATSSDLSAAMAEQSLINEALCAENCVGRWLWKSGTLKSGYGVPWEAQSVNTCPDNFLWEKDKISVMTVAAGLYEVKMGFFARKVDKLQILVNGETVKVISSKEGGGLFTSPSGGSVSGNH